MNQLLDEIDSASRKLLTTMHAESAALNSADTEELSQIAEQKQQQVAELNRLDARRCALIATTTTATTTSTTANNAPTNLSIDDAFAEMLATDRTLKARWDQIVELSVQCQRQNQINGAIINARQAHAQRTLDILSGRSSTTQLYTAQGAQVGASSRTAYLVPDASA